MYRVENKLSEYRGKGRGRYARQKIKKNILLDQEMLFSRFPEEEQLEG